ncbi:MAG: hypothetical protein CMM06_01350 [Rhodopirellula sp.]|nr:hypothetical protein [Rhodopirellula sp.]|tara:strand:- start:32643 stop:33365 length:723 start_codon:yes stop_codon:yes gene_type:complete
MGQRFFLESSPAPDATTIDLGGQEAQHLIKVMRAKPGAVVELFDGTDMEWQAEITDIRRNSATLRLLSSEVISREPSIELTLGIALPKGDRQKWVIARLVELGVQRIVPLTTDYGVAQPVEKAIDRLRRQVIEASKQCGRNKLMEITAPQSFNQFIELAEGQRWIAHPLSAPGASEHQSASSLQSTTGQTYVAIGPEGGFSINEVQLAEGQDWQALDLGSRILRIETAALAIASLVLLGK